MPATHRSEPDFDEVRLFRRSAAVVPRPPLRVQLAFGLSTARGEARNLASQRPGFLMPCLEIVQMVGKHKLSGKTKRVARSEANLGQKDAELQKTQAELEKVSEAQFSHMEGGKAAKAALKQKAKIESK